MCTRRAVCSPLKLEMSSSDNMETVMASTHKYIWSSRTLARSRHEAIESPTRKIMKAYTRDLTAANETNDCKSWPGVKSFFPLFSFFPLRETASLIFKWRWIIERGPTRKKLSESEMLRLVSFYSVSRRLLIRSRSLPLSRSKNWNDRRDNESYE